MDHPRLHIEPTFSRKRVRQLLHAGEPPHVSLFMPTHRSWNKVKDNRLTLRSLLKEVQATLHQRGESGADSPPFLQPTLDLVDDDTFWRESADGLALFVAPGHFSSHRFPFPLPQRQFVDKRFHIRPIWRHLEPDGRFYVLALAQGGIKLARASRYELREVDLEGVPTNLEEALRFDEHIRSIIFHTKTQPGAAGDPLKRAAMYYGQEDAGDKTYVKEGIARFFRELDNAVCNVLGHEPTPPPLVLAGVEYVRGLYRKVSHYQHLIEEGIEGELVDWTAGDWDAGTLHERGWSLVEPHFDHPRRDAEARYDQLAATTLGWTVGSIKTVIPAAYDYRIDTLFVPEDVTVWGRYDPTTHEATVHTDPQPADTELMNAAATRTLSGGGTLYVVDPPDVPGGNAVAGILRY